MKRLLPTLMTLLGVALLIYILWKANLPATWGKLKQTRILWAALSLVFILIMIWLKGVRWSYLLKMQGVSYPIWDSFLIYMGSLYWGTVTPGRMGDFMKVLYLKRDRKMGLGLGMSSVLVDRVFDLYILLVLGCLGLLLHPLPNNPRLVQGVWIFFATLILISYLAFNRKTGEWLMKTIFQKAMGDKLKGRADQAFQEFHQGMESFYRPAILWPTLLTVTSYAFFFTGCWFLAVALGIDLSLFYLTFCVAMCNLVSLLSFAGVGTREGTIILLFHLVNIEEQTALAYDALFVFVAIILICVLGFFCYLAKPVKFGKDSLTGEA